MAEKNIKILVIDDEEVVLQFFRELNQKMNMSITCCSFGGEGIEKVKKNDYTLVFIDTEMPPPNGYEIFKALKDIKLHTPLFMMAYQASDPLLEKALSEGARGCVFKPPDLDQVTSLVQHIVVEKFFKSEIESALCETQTEFKEPLKQKKVG